MNQNFIGVLEEPFSCPAEIRALPGMQHSNKCTFKLPSTYSFGSFSNLINKRGGHTLGLTPPDMQLTDDLYTGVESFEPSQDAKDYLNAMLGICGGVVLQGAQGSSQLKPWVAKRCIELGVPILAVCQGHQAVHKALGGKLDRLPPDLAKQHDRSWDKRHPVSVDKGSLLSKLVGGGEISTNTAHTKHVVTPGDYCVVTAWAKDGTIEASESEKLKILTTQWHPELQTDEQMGLFNQFMEWSQQRSDRLQKQAGYGKIMKMAMALKDKLFGEKRPEITLPSPQ